MKDENQCVKCTMTNTSGAYIKTKFTKIKNINSLVASSPLHK